VWGRGVGENPESDAGTDWYLGMYCGRKRWVRGLMRVSDPAADSGSRRGQSARSDAGSPRDLLKGHETLLRR